MNLHRLTSPTLYEGESDRASMIVKLMKNQIGNIRENGNGDLGKVFGAAAIAGAILSLKMMGAAGEPPAQFQFRQSVGSDRLVGEIRGDDRDADGILELSELEHFEARLGGRSWERDDLEVFALNLEAEKPSEAIAGLSLFARHRDAGTSSLLEISNSKIYGLEYGQHRRDRVLFSQANTVEVVAVRPPLNSEIPKVFGLFGVGGLLIALGWITRDRNPVLDPSPNSASEPG